MKTRGKAALQQELDAIPKRIDEAHDKAERHRHIAAAADAKRPDLARQQAAGKITAEAAESELQELDATIRRHLGMAEHEDGVAAALEEFKVEEARLVARHEAAVAADEFARRLEHRNEAATQLVKALTAARKAAARLVEARERADEAKRAAEELAGAADVDLDLPANADEPAWPDELDLLVELINAGPRTPLARAAAERERAERADAARRESAIEQAVWDALRGYGKAKILGSIDEHEARLAGHTVRKGGLPEEDREEALRRVKEARAFIEHYQAAQQARPPEERRPIQDSDVQPFVVGRRWSREPVAA